MENKANVVEKKSEASEKQGQDQKNSSRDAFSNEFHSSLSKDNVKQEAGSLSNKDSQAANANDANGKVDADVCKAPDTAAPETLPTLTLTDTPVLSPGQLTTRGKGLVAKADLDGSGSASKEEVAKLFQDNSIKGPDAQALTTLYKRFDELQKLNGGPKSGISAGDLDEFAGKETAQWERANSANKLADWSKSSLKNFDTDGSGRLTKQEIETAMNSQNTAQADKDMLGVLGKLDIVNGNAAGASADDINSYKEKIWSDTEDAKLVLGAWQTEHAVSETQKAKISRDLFADKNNPLKSINPEAISQGSIGDCYFVSSLASLAKSNPQAIKDAIKDNGNGTYTVTFPGAKDEPITINAPTEAEQATYNQASEHGTWASVMEKAYGKYCQEHWYRRGPFQSAGLTPAEGAEGGGITSRAMNLLTNNSIDTDELFLTRQSTVARKLEEAFKNNKSVAAGITKGIFAESTKDNFYMGHAYSVTNFVPDGKGGGQITIRNPWGQDAGKESTRGTITMPLDKFMKNFSDISYEQ
jgi:hypothetical protein